MNEREYRQQSEARKRVVSKRREEQATRRQFGRFAIVVLLLAAAIVGVALYILCFVREIKVVNNQYSDTSEVITWIQEDPMIVNSIAMYVKYNYMETELPGQMRDVEVSMNSPWSITLKIHDKMPIAGIKQDDKYLYCDEDGRVILVANTPMKGLTLITNVDTLQYKKYEILEVEDTKIFSNAVEVMNALKEESLEIDEISCSGGAKINIVMGELDIYLGEGDYPEKIAQIQPIITNINGEAGTLDLSKYSSNSDIITFVPKNSEN